MIFSYIDPGTGSMLISAIIALISVAYFMAKGIIYRTFGLGGSKGEVVDPSTKRNVVIYSEGKQYWNVFKNIVEGCSEEGIQLSYFTSGKDDPGLSIDLEGVETKYIGSGKEAYFILNRLNANVVMMTTPGLDVLEIKRSKDVNYYIHITHATGSVADYKTYGVDYFDCVMIGGNGDIEVIRELEKFRGLPEKDIMIIGHTYLDVLRDKIDQIEHSHFQFEEKRPTILVSPTWGMYSLTNNNGKELLSRLEELDQYNVIIRPHPQSFISDEKIINELLEMFPQNGSRIWDIGTDNIYAMYESDLMISDYSGIIFDYYSLFKKPILTMQSLFKREGLDAMDLENGTWNIGLLNEIGVVISDNDIASIDQIIDSQLLTQDSKANTNLETLNMMSMYEGESKSRAMTYLKEILETHGEVIDSVSALDTEDIVSSKSSRVNDFLINFFITSVVLTATVILALNFIIPEGVTSIFLTTLLKPMKIINIVSFIVILGYVWLINKGIFTFTKSMERIKLTNLPLALIPMIPIIQYICANQDILDAKSNMSILIVFFVVSFVVTVIIPFILSPFTSKSMLEASLTALIFTIYNMATYGGNVVFLNVVAIMAVVMVIIFILNSTRKQKTLAILSMILFTSTSVFSLSNVSTFGVPKDALSEKDRMFIDYVKDNTVVNTPSIYILVYDSYANEETFDQYGFDNSDQMNYLLDQGFSIYDGTYSIGYTSLISMSHVLQTTAEISGTVNERNAISGNNTTMFFMNQAGYDTNIVMQSDYMFQGFPSKYTNTFPKDEQAISAEQVIKNAIVEGEFRSDASFSEVTYSDFLEMKKTTLRNPINNPVFYYTHDDFPGHTSFYRDFDGGEEDRYLNNLPSANEKMREEIEIIKENDPNAIIVILGDHGPYITNGGVNMNNYVDKDLTQLDMQDRYGTFLAIHWPVREMSTKYDIKLIQDVMPAVYSYIYEDDSLFDSLRFNRKSIETTWFGGTEIVEGVIVGGPDDGRDLFNINGVRFK